MRAHSISGTIELKRFAETFGDRKILLRKTSFLVDYEGGWLVAHDFGAVVFFDIPAEEEKRILEALKKLIAGEAREPYTEEFLVQVTREGSRPSVLFDRIEVPELSRSIVELVALVIGQSVALEYYEEDVNRILREIDTYAEQLAQSGKFRSSSSELHKFVGRGMALRNRAIYTLALLDSPLQTWNDEYLDTLHRNLRQNFAIRDRYDELEHELQVIRDNLDIFVEITRERRAFVLEMSVILLILVEVVLALVEHGKKLVSP